MYLLVEQGDYTLTQLSQAAAKAVCVLWGETAFSDYSAELFDEWSDGLYRKILKRVKPKDFAKVEAAAAGVTVVTEVGVRLRATVPLRRSLTPPAIKRAQVAGLQVLPESEEPAPRELIHVALNTLVPMSPAKAAVAAAHAAHKAMGALDTRSVNTYLEWNDRGYPISLSWEPLYEATETLVTIHDSGLTEVEPNSITAAALYNAAAL